MTLGSWIVGAPGALIATNVCAPVPTSVVTGHLSA